MRRLALLFFSLSLFALNGCYGHHGAHVHSHHHHHGGGDLALAATVGILAGAAIVASAESDRPRQPEPVYYQPVVYVSTTPTPASPRDRVASDDNGSTFDAKSARAALGAVDLSACRAEGAPRGYGHAKVTFNPDGKASKVVVDTPDGLSSSAVTCIGDRLGAVVVPEYQGNLVTVGTTWFVP